MPISPDRIKDIKKLFRDNGISYDRGARTILFTDVNFQWFQRLKDFDNAAFQLSGDLAALNRITRLSDGSTPFEVWLHNAAEQFSDIDTENVLNHALDEVKSAASSAAPIADPANVPAVEVREAIVQQNDMVYYGFLQSGALAGESVGRLHVPRHENGIPVVKNQEPTTYQGTGWLVSPDLIVTNHHVVNARDDGESNASSLDLGLQSQNTLVEFDFNSKDTAGHVVSAKTLEAFETVPGLRDFALVRANYSKASASKPGAHRDHQRLLRCREYYSAPIWRTKESCFAEQPYLRQQLSEASLFYRHRTRFIRFTGI